MKTSVPKNLTETYAAHAVAAQLQDTLEADDYERDVLIAFHSVMSEYKQDSYAHLEVVGVGSIA